MYEIKETRHVFSSLLHQLNKRSIGAQKRVNESDLLDLLDRLSSLMESARTLSSNKLFFSRIRPGNVDDE